MSDTGTEGVKGTEPYGKSGSILSVNPTDKHTQEITGLTPAELRSPEVVRTWEGMSSERPEEPPPEGETHSRKRKGATTKRK